MAESHQVAKVTFASQTLARLGIPNTQANVAKFVTWINAEGGNWNNTARYNPLNTTLAKPGATSINSDGVKAYTSWEQGYEATVQTLKLPAYADVLKTLRSGSTAAFEQAVNASPWGTQFSGVPTASGNAEKSVEEEGVTPLANKAASAVGSALGFSWPKLGEFALTTLLLLVGAVLVIGGIFTFLGKKAPLPIPVPV